MSIDSSCNRPGCIPLVGTIVGIGRIAIALNKAQEHKITNCTASIFESLRQTGGHKEIYHGMCEIVPVFGPLLYGVTYLCMSKMPFASWSKPEPILPTKTEPKETKASIQIENFHNCQELKQYIGQMITICVTRYAHGFFKDDYRSMHGFIANQRMTGILESVGDTPTARGRYAIQIKGYYYINGWNKHTFYLSDEELALCSSQYFIRDKA